MTANDELKRIFMQCRYEPELADVAGKVADAGLETEQECEALRRIRSKTKSILMQYSITGVLGDDWTATPDNSMVQPYFDKE